MSDYVTLLAKTPINKNAIKEEEKLTGHSCKTIECFQQLFGELANPTRLAVQWLHFFRLELPEHFDFFWTNGIAACSLHDIGKANTGFQDVVSGKSNEQIIRHEHLSGLILFTQQIQDWLKKTPYLNFNIVLCSVIGHHLKANHENFADPLKPDSDCKVVDVYPMGISELLRLTADTMGVSQPSDFEVGATWSFNEQSMNFNVTRLCENLKRSLYKYKKGFRKDDTEFRLLMSVRAALAEADSAASGLVREDKNVKEWINEAFSEISLLNGNAINEKVISPRIAQIKKNQDSFRWFDFQNAAENLPERAMLLSPCGSGKTLAAWRWIKSRAIQRPVSRVIFLYPTRGTATEGFKDYVSWAPEADAALVHGTAAYDLEGMFQNPDDERKYKDFTTEDRLYALGYWQRRIFSATVDQFLGFMQHSYRSTCLLPLLVDSVVVIDEVHSLDKGLFSALKLFLRNFNVPVLCMTASLSLQRLQDLKDCGLEVFPSMEDSTFSDLEAMAKMLRYKVRVIKSSKEAKEIALKAIGNKQRVLWVLNTVNRCQELAKELNASCYHSRFKLEDRKKRHNEIVAAFKPGQDTILAATTQVCEMSLDLDADIIISETAPITSMIQRMGRCNRHSRPDSGKTGDVYIYSPDDRKPYKNEDLNGVDDFLDKIDGQCVSQLRLQELLEKYGPGEVEVERYTAFLESYAWAESREASLRDSDQFTVEAILDEDVEEYQRLMQERKPIDGLIVPVPRYLTQPDYKPNRYIRIAKASHYLPEYGFFNQPVRKENEGK